MAQEKRQQLSKEQTPKTLKPGEIRKFKWLTAGSIDPLTNEPCNISGATLSGISTVWDNEKGEIVMIKNITGVSIGKDKDGKEVTEEIVSPIEFDNTGMCYVNHKQPETYLFLSRDNRNQSNPFRDKSVPALWYEVTDVNVKEVQRFQSNLRYDALHLVKTSDIKAVIAIAEILAEQKLISIKIKGNTNTTDIRAEIEGVCEVNPSAVIRAGKEKLPKVKLDIQDAVNHSEIEFQTDGNTWVWKNEDWDTKTIYKTTPGHDPVEELAQYLLKEEEDMAKKPKEERAETMLQKIKDTLKEASYEV